MGSGRTPGAAGARPQWGLAWPRLPGLGMKAIWVSRGAGPAGGSTCPGVGGFCAEALPPATCLRPCVGGSALCPCHAPCAGGVPARVWGRMCGSLCSRVLLARLPGRPRSEHHLPSAPPAAAGLDSLCALPALRPPHQGLQQPDPAGGAGELYLLRESEAGAGRRGTWAAHRQQGDAGTAARDPGGSGHGSDLLLRGEQPAGPRVPCARLLAGVWVALWREARRRSAGLQPLGSKGPVPGVPVLGRLHTAPDMAAGRGSGDAFGGAGGEATLAGSGEGLPHPAQGAQSCRPDLSSPPRGSLGAWQPAPCLAGPGQPTGAPPSGSQVPPGGNKTQYDEVGIPAALLSYKDQLDIFRVGPPPVCGVRRWAAGRGPWAGLRHLSPAVPRRLPPRRRCPCRPGPARPEAWVPLGRGRWVLSRWASLRGGVRTRSLCGDLRQLPGSAPSRPPTSPGWGTPCWGPWPGLSCTSSWQSFGRAVRAALYAPHEPMLDYNMVVIFITAVGTVALGGYWAGARDVKK